MEDTLNGFQVFEDLMPGGSVRKDFVEPKQEEVEGASEELTDEELEALRNKGKDNKDAEEEEDVEDTEEEKEDVKSAKKTKKTVKEEEVEEEQEEDDTVEEPEHNDTVTAFFEVMSEKMGWELGEDDEIPSTPEELVEYFKDVIEENSVPEYSSEEVQKLDEFVKNGGNLKDYFLIDGELDIEELDITEDEVNQKLVLKEFMKEKGYSSKQIEKKLNKYEEAGLLEDEATDALEALKEIREEKKQQLLKDQEIKAKKALERQQDYFNSVVNEIKGMNDIRGIKIPEKDKRALLEYIFKPTADGSTQYQKDWAKSTKNLLESAYFTMKGDTLLKAAKDEGSNAAITKFKTTLSRTGISRKTKKQDNTSTESMWDSFARQLRVN